MGGVTARESLLCAYGQGWSVFDANADYAVIVLVTHSRFYDLLGNL